MSKIRFGAILKDDRILAKYSIREERDDFDHSIMRLAREQMQEGFTYARRIAAKHFYIRKKVIGDYNFSLFSICLENDIETNENFMKEVEDALEGKLASGNSLVDADIFFSRIIRKILVRVTSPDQIRTPITHLQIKRASQSSQRLQLTVWKEMSRKGYLSWLGGTISFRGSWTRLNR